MHVRDGSGHTPLLWAAACGKVGVVRQLVEVLGGARPDTEGGEEEKEAVVQPMHAAACVGAVEICQVLLEGGAKVRLGVHMSLA